MSTIGVLLVRWLTHAIVVMGAVALVSPKNPRNMLPRALFVTFLVALVVTPFAFFWFLVIPGIIALVCWILVFVIAYDISVGQAIARWASCRRRSVFWSTCSSSTAGWAERPFVGSFGPCAFSGALAPKSGRR